MNHEQELAPQDEYRQHKPSCVSNALVRMPDLLGLLRHLAALEPPLFVFGSVAEATLLDGKLSQR